jgi:GT2 family glycosyltransferase
MRLKMYPLIFHQQMKRLVFFMAEQSFSNLENKRNTIFLPGSKSEAYLSGIVFPQPAAFFRRSFLDKVGFLNESFHYGMDYDLFLRLSLVCDFFTN